MFGHLDILDSTSVVHALSFLKTLEEFIHTASTCTAAEALIRENWTTLKPDAKVFNSLFVAQLATTGTASTQKAYYVECNKPEAVPRLLEDATPITRTLNLIARQGKRLPLFNGQAVTQLKLIDLPEHAVEVKLIVGAANLVHIQAAIAKLFRSEDGSLELMQFLKHLMRPQWQDVVIWCSEDAALVTIEHFCEPVHGGHWLVDEVQSNVYGFVHQPLPLYFNFTADYMAVIFHPTKDHSTWSAESVKSFTLFSIPGWACRKKTTYHKSIYYQIPVQRQINFSRVDTCALEVEFHVKPSEDVQAHVVALGQNVLLHNGMMMGLKFCS
jgi:hypothetical protein